jgi:hypothetical protein
VIEEVVRDELPRVLRPYLGHRAHAVVKHGEHAGVLEVGPGSDGDAARRSGQPRRRRLRGPPADDVRGEHEGFLGALRGERAEGVADRELDVLREVGVHGLTLGEERLRHRGHRGGGIVLLGLRVPRGIHDGRCRLGLGGVPVAVAAGLGLGLGLGFGLGILRRRGIYLSRSSLLFRGRSLIFRGRSLFLSRRGFFLSRRGLFLSGCGFFLSGRGRLFLSGRGLFLLSGRSLFLSGRGFFLGSGIFFRGRGVALSGSLLCRGLLCRGLLGGGLLGGSLLGRGFVGHGGQGDGERLACAGVCVVVAPAVSVTE